MTPPTAARAPGGLTSAEALARRREVGPNRIPERRSHPLLALLRKLSGPVPWMLEATFALELALRNHVDAAVVGALLVVNALVAFVQERRAQGALALLRARLHVTTRARRDGRWQEIDAGDLVPDDVIHVRMGDLVPADLRLVDGDLLLDQSSLTGESAPVEAHAGDAAYSGATVRHGEATAVVTATGPRSYFGKTAALVELAKSESHLEALIVGIVKYLVVVEAVIAAIVAVTAIVRALPYAEVVPFVLMLLIASVPVALPATFTLATALGALELSSRGVLVTRLSAIEEAAAMQVLCSDKTGTLTQNRLTVVAVRALAPYRDDDVLRLAALASDEATQDPLDVAILRARSLARDAAPDDAQADAPERLSFVPFDPATKRAEALVRIGGEATRVVKGAPQAIASLLGDASLLAEETDRLAADGNRVLAIAAGPASALRPVGLVGFLDPPRDDAGALVRRLRALGVRVMMVTGDAAPTARAVARRLELGERVGTREEAARAPGDFDVVAGVLPEDKFHLVRALQASGLVVGMTGDGVNDAPALKQAEVGVAVASATDVAKAAASVVLTRAGLAGCVAAVETGRRIFQRMLTYTLNKIVKTFEIALFLSVGLVATGALVTTPRLILLLLFTNDFVTMSLASDRVAFSHAPDRWDVRSIVTSALVLAAGWFAFALAVLFVARGPLGLALPQIQTLSFLVLVFAGQANVYLVRERHHFWRTRPGGWMALATVADLVGVSVLATTGTLMTAVPASLVGGLLVAVLAYALALDLVKVAAFRRLGVGAPREARA